MDEVDLAGAVVDRHDGERRLGADPVLHERALNNRPADARRTGRLIDSDTERRLIRDQRKSQLTTGQARANHRAPPGRERLGRSDGVEHDVGGGVEPDCDAIVGANCHRSLLQLKRNIAPSRLLYYRTPKVASTAFPRPLYAACLLRSLEADPCPLEIRPG